MGWYGKCIWWWKYFITLERTDRLELELELERESQHTELSASSSVCTLFYFRAGKMGWKLEPGFRPGFSHLGCLGHSSGRCEEVYSTILTSSKVRTVPMTPLLRTEFYKARLRVRTQWSLVREPFTTEIQFILITVTERHWLMGEKRDQNYSTRACWRWTGDWPSVGWWRR